MSQVGKRRQYEMHGARKSAEYRVWDGMLQRCLNPNNEAYVHYGGRGITVCSAWQTSFQAFLHDMGQRPFPGAQIERRDNDGPYAPFNCYWATREEQSRNKRSNHLITYDGKTQTVTDWGREVGLPYNTIIERLNAGWSIPDALLRPPQRGKKVGHRIDAHLVTYQGKTQSVAAWEAEYGMQRDLLLARLRAGWGVERALLTPKALRKGK